MSGEIEVVAAAVRSKQVSAAEVVELTLKRIESVNPALNAVIARCDDQARLAARQIDAAIDRGEDPGALAGVPVLIKDLEDVEGMVTTQGSLLFADATPAAAHDTVPRRLVDAGAVIVGKTNLPEFATEGYTSNLLFGTTNNPWSLDYSPGGSSGGSGAAVAAGIVPIATATDGGGSIRIPASFCGLAGIKPTNGVVGRWPAPSWIDFSTAGPLATSVGDLRLLLSIESGPVFGDPTGVPQAASFDGSSVDSPTRLFSIDRFGTDDALPPEVRTVYDASVRNMGELLRTEPVVVTASQLFGEDVNSDLDWTTIAAAEHVARFGRSFIESSLDQMHPGARDFMQWGLEVQIDDYLAARRRRFDFVRAVDELLGRDGVLLSPTVVATGWLADGRMTKADEPGMLPPEVFNTAIQNVTGHPALSLPAGQFANGVPFGLQVTGPRYADGMLLDLAGQWEAQQPWPVRAPGYDGLAAALGLG
jgi:Asp-tRNA(Asn)/Glu-tRNA(Gln) amidotransferase A subunit family amidase